MANWENPENFARRVGQSKAVWFSPGMTFRHKTRPALGSRNRVGFTRQHRRIFVDENPSPEPYNSEHRQSCLTGT